MASVSVRITRTLHSGWRTSAEAAITSLHKINVQFDTWSMIVYSGGKTLSRETMPDDADGEKQHTQWWGILILFSQNTWDFCQKWSASLCPRLKARTKVLFHKNNNNMNILHVDSETISASVCSQPSGQIIFLWADLNRIKPLSHCCNGQHYIFIGDECQALGVIIIFAPLHWNKTQSADSITILGQKRLAVCTLRSVKLCRLSRQMSNVCAAYSSTSSRWCITALVTAPWYSIDQNFPLLHQTCFQPLSHRSNKESNLVVTSVVSQFSPIKALFSLTSGKTSKAPAHGNSSTVPPGTCKAVFIQESRFKQISKPFDTILLLSCSEREQGRHIPILPKNTASKICQKMTQVEQFFASVDMYLKIHVSRIENSTADWLVVGNRNKRKRNFLFPARLVQMIAMIYFEANGAPCNFPRRGW